MKAANGETMDSLSPTIQSYLKEDIDEERLKTQLLLVRDMILKNATWESRPVTRVTNVRTIVEAMSTSDIYKTMLSEVNKVLITFPVTIATAEWSFSALRRLKSQDLLTKYDE